MKYRPDTLGFDPPQRTLSQAIKVVEGVHNSVDKEEWVGIRDKVARKAAKNSLGRFLRKKEQIALYEWSRANGHLINSREFTSKWERGGERGEAENEVYFDEDSNTWFKRNDLAYHDTYLSFLQRVSLHNHHFPEAPLTLMGFMVDDNRAIPDGGRMLKPVLSQGHVEAERGATVDEVDGFMKDAGYSRIPGKEFDYYNPHTHIRIEDLHDENVLYKGGHIYFVDPVIFLDDRGKISRLSGSLNRIEKALVEELLDGRY